MGGLYAQELGRAPDAGGLAAWQDHLGTDKTLAQVRAGIANSTEAGSDIRDLDLYASGQTPTDATVASEQATLSQGGSLNNLYTLAVTAVGAGFIGSPDQYREALRQIRQPSAGVDGPLSTIGTAVRNVLEWAARKAPGLGAVGAAAAVLLTPTNAQQTTTEVGVAGDPDLGARYTRAPGSLNGMVTLYARGPDGQPAGEGITLQASADGQLTGPPGSPLAGVVFGTLPPGNIFEGVQLAPGLTAALGQQAPQVAPGSGIEVRTQEEADLVASLQAQGKSPQEIQAALDEVRGITGSASVAMSIADPARQVMGPGRISNPAGVATLTQAIEATGVTIKERPGSLGYQPGAIPGEPGVLIIDPDASYSAWLHEYQHVIDDQAAGWSGIRIIADPDTVWAREQSAYNVEISYVLSQGHQDVAQQLEVNMETERKRLFDLDQED